MQGGQGGWASLKEGTWAKIPRALGAENMGQAHFLHLPGPSGWLHTEIIDNKCQ